MEWIEAELIDDIEAVGGSSDGKHVALKARIEGQERILAIPQEDIMSIVSGLLGAYDANEERRKRPEPQLAVMVEGFHVGPAADGCQLVVILQFGAAGRLSFGFEPEDAEALAQIIMAQLGGSDRRPH